MTTTHTFNVGGTVFTVRGVPTHADGLSWISDIQRAELQVASELARRGIVTGPAMKFVRKTLGFKVTELAELLGCPHHEMVMWYETGAIPVDRCMWLALAALVADRRGERSDVFAWAGAAADPGTIPTHIELRYEEGK